jgi:hypothetical protein
MNPHEVPELGGTHSEVFSSLTDFTQRGLASSFLITRDSVYKWFSYILLLWLETSRKFEFQPQGPKLVEVVFAFWRSP